MVERPAKSLAYDIVTEHIAASSTSLALVFLFSVLFSRHTNITASHVHDTDGQRHFLKI